MPDVYVHQHFNGRPVKKSSYFVEFLLFGGFDQLLG